MPEQRVKLIRKDGTTLDVTPEQAEKLKLLGYRAESPREALDRTAASAEKEHYEGQKGETVTEGVLRGATFGASDYLLGDKHTAKRAQHNPGVAMASEIAGAVGTAFVPGSPVARTTKALGDGAKAIGLTGKTAATVVGGAEGAVFGGSMAANQAYLKGDPITSEAVLHGAGWGALFGAGISAGAASLSSRGAANITRGAAQQADGAALGKMPGSLGRSADDVATRELDIAAREAALAREVAETTGAKNSAMVRNAPQKFEATPGTYEAVAGPSFRELKSETSRFAAELTDAVKTTEAVLTGNPQAMARLGFSRTMDEGAIGTARLQMQEASDTFIKALNKEGFTEKALTEATEAYEKTVGMVAAKAGLARDSAGRTALSEFAQSKFIAREVNRFPHTPAAFAKMSEERAERLFGAMEAASKMSNFPALGRALDEQANKLAGDLGLEHTGVAGLRNAWQAARKQVKAETTKVKDTHFADKAAEYATRRAELAADRAALSLDKARTPKPEAHKPRLSQQAAGLAVGFGAFKAVTATGHPLMAIGAGRRARKWFLNRGAPPTTDDLVAMRNDTVGRVRQAVGRYQAKAGGVVQKVGPKLQPLAMKLDGTLDESTTDRRQLAYNRIKEFADAAPHIQNTMYRAVEPLTITQPELALGISQAGVSHFMAMWGAMPADPGVVSGLKSIWKPSDLQAEVMSRQLSVFHDPVGMAEEMLTTEIYDPISIKALREFAPAVFQEMRSEMLEKITTAGFLDNMSYGQQVTLGSLLDIPIHSSMKPEYIAASLQRHVKRNEPLPTPAIPGSTNGGRPAADTPGATAAQITTSR